MGEKKKHNTGAEERSSPAFKAKDLELSEIIDIQVIRPLMLDFFKHTNIPIGLNDLKGNALIGIGWQDICTKFHRVHPETCKSCLDNSNNPGEDVPSGEFKLFKCKNNMWEAVTPIMVEGEKIGNIFAKQFFFEDEPLDYEFFRSQARKYGFNEEEYITAVEKAPRLSREALNRGMAFFMAFANMLSHLSYNNIKLARSLAERKKVEESLKKAHDNLEWLVKERTSELEKAYVTLKEREKGLAEAQKMAHIGNWDWDLVTNELSYSDELYRIFGLIPQESEVPFDKVLTYIHPEDRDYVINSIMEALNGKIYDAIDFRIILTDGTERSIHTQGEVTFGEKNNPVRLRGTVQDITERRKMDEALRESEEKYRNIVETANEGIIIIDNRTVITFANHKMKEMFGYDVQEGIGRSLWDYVSAENRVIIEKNMEKWQHGIIETYEIELICKDGSLVWALVNAKPLFDRNGKDIGVLSMITDITERKKAEEKIKNLAKIVESSNDAILTGSLDGTIISWNKGAEQVFGYPPEDVLGKNVAILEPANLKGETKQLLKAIKQGKKVQHYETLRLKKDGMIINVSVTLSPLFDQNGKFTAISAIARDITERKTAEKLFQEKQMAEAANRTKNDFLASISHELRTPLNSIIGFSDLLYEQVYGELNEKQLRSVGNISKSGKHLLNLINNLLDISKIEAGKMELIYKDFDLAARLNMVLNFLFPIASKKNIKIKIDIDSKLPSISADEEKFVQIMYNLIDNAIKFSYENSLIKVKARKKVDLVEITVEDTGKGISIEDQSRLFKPFSQAYSFSSKKLQGTGLGLSLVKQIVHLHGGYVWFRSSPGKGSTFAFAIPIKNK